MRFDLAVDTWRQIIPHSPGQLTSVVGRKFPSSGIHCYQLASTAESSADGNQIRRPVTHSHSHRRKLIVMAATQWCYILLGCRGPFEKRRWVWAIWATGGRSPSPGDNTKHVLTLPQIHPAHGIRILRQRQVCRECGAVGGWSLRMGCTSVMCRDLKSKCRHQQWNLQLYKKNYNIIYKL